LSELAWKFRPFSVCKINFGDCSDNAGSGMSDEGIFFVEDEFEE